MAAWLNAWCADFAARVPDAVHCATLYAEPDAPAYVRSAVESGARLFKVHVQVGEFAPDDPMLDDAWDTLQQNQIPVVIHCGSGPHPGTHTGVPPIRRLLTRFPRLTLVIAHAGLPEYDEFADLATEFANVHLDTTMVGTDFTESMAPMPPGYPARLRDLQDKVVLGSDFPNIPYPYAHQIEALDRLDLGADWMRSVLWHNGARLLGLT
ncbi:amidohydrolase family protein [Luteipulveratus flavus]|uniref:amidohydrolase family protein n=1 Tax=Luteipulveratus flavus TaxID=3031728 RepID=UPI003211F7B0